MGAKKLRLAAFVFALGSCALLGCSGDTSSDNVTEHCGGTPSDAGKSDAGVDAVTDATDAGQHDAPVEAQPDAADAEQGDASSLDATGDAGHADADTGAQADADASPPDVVADTSVDAPHDTSQGGDAASDSAGGSDGAASDGTGEAANDDALPACDYVNGNAVCSACEEDPLNCPHDPTAQPHCGDFPSASDQALCKAVFECVRNNPCYANPIACFCGTATASTCASAANGACLTQILAGLKTMSVAQAFNVITDVTLPGGAAMSLIQCDVAACPDSCIPYNAHCP